MSSILQSAMAHTINAVNRSVISYKTTCDLLHPRSQRQLPYNGKNYIISNVAWFLSSIMENYRILRVTPLQHFTATIEAIKKEHPDINSASYDEQLNVLLHSGYFYSDSFSKAMRSLGNDALDIFFDVEALQKTWAREHGVGYGEKTWQVDILLGQIAALKPDILYFHSSVPIPQQARKNIKRRFPFLKLLALYYGYPATADCFEGMDMAFMAAPCLRHYAVEAGIEPHVVYHSFDPSILNRMGEGGQTAGEPMCNFTFIGSSGYQEDRYGNPFLHPAHVTRYGTLTKLLAETDITIWENDLVPEANTSPQSRISVVAAGISKNILRKLNADELNGLMSNKAMKGIFLGDILFNHISAILGERFIRSIGWDDTVASLQKLHPRRCHGAVFGTQMFKLLRRSKVTFNIHTDARDGDVGNMRLFEATGVGACLLTDSGANMGDLFEADSEVVTYSSPDEAVEKARFLLANETVRKQIASAGQRRTLKDHTVLQRCERIHHLLRDKLLENSAKKSFPGKEPTLLLNLATVISDESKTNAFLETALPSLLSRGNIPSLGNGISVKLKIFVSEEVKKQLEKSDFFRETQASIQIDVAIYSEHNPKMRQRLVAAQEAAQDGAILIYFDPHDVISDGAIPRLVEKARSGALVIVAPVFPIERNCFGDFSGYGAAPWNDQPNLANCVAEQLRSKCFRLRHSLASPYPFLAWPLKSGVAVRSPVMRPLLINFLDWRSASIPIAESGEFIPEGLSMENDITVVKLDDNVLWLHLSAAESAPPDNFILDDHNLCLSSTYILPNAQLVGASAIGVKITGLGAFLLALWLNAVYWARNCNDACLSVVGFLNRRIKIAHGYLDKMDLDGADGRTARIAVLQTAPAWQVRSMVSSIKTQFPDANITIICKMGSENIFANPGNDTKSVPALPSRMFCFWDIPLAWYRVRRHFYPDVLVIACNNPERRGYFNLENLAALAAKRAFSSTPDGETHAISISGNILELALTIMVHPLAYLCLSLLAAAGQAVSGIAMLFSAGRKR